ncbi:hypothetical protein [uncultured Bilophila sp.]|uniref:hypothetical protein n=1 Tax=uncultured Bilophila sp. TaxID=529385 RepID=UPI00280A6913|nr:hypothetical protein [uncultured Bilophila sp.]
MLNFVHPAQRVGAQHEIKPGVHAKGDEQCAAVTARSFVDFTHFPLHALENDRVRHGLPDVLHAAYQIDTVFSYDAPTFIANDTGSSSMTTLYSVKRRRNTCSSLTSTIKARTPRAS